MYVDSQVVMEDGRVKERLLIGFNGPASLAWKMELAYREGLGGVMIWEVRGIRQGID